MWVVSVATPILVWAFLLITPNWNRKAVLFCFVCICSIVKTPSRFARIANPEESLLLCFARSRRHTAEDSELVDPHNQCQASAHHPNLFTKSRSLLCLLTVRWIASVFFCFADSIPSFWTCRPFKLHFLLSSPTMPLGSVSHSPNLLSSPIQSNPPSTPLFLFQFVSFF